MDEFVPQRSAAYVSQHDLHMAELTVRETVSFSAKCQGVGHHYDLLMELLRREKEENIKPDPEIDMYLKLLLLSIDVPFDKSKSHPAALKTSKYGVSKKELLKANIERGVLLMKRNSFMYMFKAIQLTLVAVNAMTVFIRTNMHHDSIENGRLYMGAQFYGMLMIMFNGLAELGLAVAKLPVFYKQRDLLFYPAWTYALPSCIIRTPISLLNTTIWVFLTYYVIGFDPNIQRFFRQFLVLLVMSEATAGQYRFIAALTRHQVIASTVGSFFILIFMLSSGFILSRDDVKKWWIWSYWMSPLMYAQNALAVNEFLGQSWNKIIDGFREPLGMLVIESRGFFPKAKWYWIGIGALIGYVLLFNILSIICLTFLSLSKSYQSTISQESLKTKQANVLDEDFQESSKEWTMNNTSYAKDDSSPKATTSHATENYVLGRKGMVLPFVSYSITFENIRYSVDMPKALKAQCTTESRLELLKDISGSFRPRVLTALMGVSGAGKTTLLDVLSGRKTNGYIEAIVMRAIRNTVDTGRTVVCTIHQPSIDLFESFDELFLLKRGGEERYVGPLGQHSCELIKYFEAIEGVNKIKDGYNPSTWMLEVTSMVQEQKTRVNFTQVYKNSELYRRNKRLIKELSTPPEGSSDLLFPTEYSQPLITQFLACLWKQRLSYSRNLPYVAVKYFFAIVVALLYGTMFWGVGKKRQNQQALFSAMGSMYSTCLSMGVKNCMSVQPIISVERIVFYRERASHMYSPLPSALGQTLIYAVLVYAMIRYEWTIAKFFWYLFFMYFTLLYYTFYGMMAVGLTPNHSMSTVICTAFFTMWNLFSGFLIPMTRIPIWWRWYYWICPVAWTLNGLVTSQFGDVNDKFDNGVRVSDFVKNYFGYHHDLLWVTAIVVVSFAVLFAFLFGLSLKMFNFQKR
uniref:ABC transporter domain-containing protein n=1 Tax=Oryza brachyantha TaxID=4533 RepID=J3MWM4_ORYBR